MLTILRHATRKRVRATLIKPPPNLLQISSTSVNSHTYTITQHYSHSTTMLPPAGTIVFNTVGRVQYGFDVFSVDLNHQQPPPHATADHRLTDGGLRWRGAEAVGD